MTPRCYDCRHSPVCEHWRRTRRIFQADMEPKLPDMMPEVFRGAAEIVARNCRYFEPNVARASREALVERAISALAEVGHWTPAGLAEAAERVVKALEEAGR